MKKLLLLFAVMLSAVGAWAQSWNYATNVVIGNKITDFSSIEDGQKVVFKHVDRSEYIVLDANADADLTSSLSGLCVFKLHKGEGENAGKFTIESSKEGFYFPEIQSGGGWKDYVMSATPVYYEFLSKQADNTVLPSGQFVVKCASASGYFDGGLNGSNDPDFTAWEGNGPNCKYEIYEVSCLTDAYDRIQTGFYTMQSAAGGHDVYAKYDGTRIAHVALNGKEFVNCVFYFEKGEGNKYVIRLKDGRYVTYKGTGSGDQLEFKYESDVTDANKWWRICYGKSNGKLVIIPEQATINEKTPGFNFSVYYNDNNGALGLYDCDDNNSQWVLAPVAPMFAQGKAKIKVRNEFLRKDGNYLKKGDDTNCELFTLTKDTQKNRYTIQTSDGAYLTCSAITEGTQVAFAEATDANKWWIIEANNGLASGATNPVDIYPYTESFNKDNAAWNFAITVDGNANAALGIWGANGDASYCELFWEMESVLTDIAENVHTNKEYGVAGFFEPTFAGVAGYSLENKSFGEGLFTADITFPFEVSSVSELNPTLIGQGSWIGADKKWTVVDGNVKVVNGTPSLGASQWLIYPSLNGKVFTFKIKSVSADKYVTANPESDNDAYASNTPVTLTENGTAFTYTGTGCGDDKGFAYVNNSPKTLFLTRNGESDNNEFLGVYEESSSHQGSAVRFPTFNQYKISITEVGYSTLYSPFPVIVNDANYNGINKLEYFAVTSEPIENSVRLQNMTQNNNGDYIPAKQGTILKGAPETTYIFTQIDTNEEQDALWADNKLKGSVISTYVAGPAYVLSAPGGEVGLYKAELNMNEAGVNVGEETGTHFKNNAGKAYLPASAVASDARFLVFNFGDDMETGITETENGNVKTENGEVYDLSGRRIQGAQKGIFIVNGKMVVR